MDTTTYSARRKGNAVTEDTILELLENSDIDDLSTDEDEDDIPILPECQAPVGADISSDSEHDEPVVLPVATKQVAHTGKKLSWKQKPFVEKAHPVPKNFTSVQSPQKVRSPLMYFKDYFTDSFFEHAAEKTNMYYVATSGKSVKTTATELKKFLGINLLMGCIRYPRLPMYWRKGIELKAISSCMPRDRFQTLRKTLHFVDTVNRPQDAETNRLWKVQPIIDAVREVCLQLPRDSCTYSIDEQMIPFTGRCKLKQYVKNNPRPVGLKNFVVTSSSGLVLDFEIYQGKSTPLVNAELGLGPSVVMRLVRSLPLGSFVYFDRYFTTIPLLDKLAENGVEGSGTIMINRVRDIKFTQEKMKRGDSREYVRSDDKLVVVEWKDSQKVVMASTCAGVQPEAKVKRWSKAEGQYIEVKCPTAVCRYNKCMGGVDVCDQMIEYYRTWFRTKKWTLKVILHFLDLATVNCWMLYRKHCYANQARKRDVQDLLKFRLALSEALMSTPDRKRRIEVVEGEEATDKDEGNTDSPEPPTKQKIYTPSLLPCTDKRNDGYDHWPVISDIPSPRICRLEGCKSRTKIICTKCDVYLCLSKFQNCFQHFHVKK